MIFTNGCPSRPLVETSPLQDDSSFYKYFLYIFRIVSKFKKNIMHSELFLALNMFSSIEFIDDKKEHRICSNEDQYIVPVNSQLIPFFTSL